MPGRQREPGFFFSTTRYVVPTDRPIRRWRTPSWSERMSNPFTLFNSISSAVRDVEDWLSDDESETKPAAPSAPPPVDYRSLFNENPEMATVYGSGIAGARQVVRHPTLADDANDPRFPAFQQAWREGKPVEELLGDDPFSLKAKVAANGGDNWRPDVAKVQVLLDKAGYHSVRPDEGPNGYHSSTLDQDIRRFQKDNKLVVDGKLAPGGETIRAIQKSVMMNPKLNGPNDIPKLKRAEPTKPAEAMPAVLKTITGNDKPPPVKLAPGRRLFKEPDQKSEAMFEELVKNIFEKEAGYSNHEYDKGGETNYGITERTLLDYQKIHGGMGEEGVFVEPKNLTRDQAKKIYRNEFFYGQRVNEISDLGVASALIDSFVLHGPGYGWQLFQKSVNAIDKENNLA
jgi:hypothetical protein